MGGKSSEFDDGLEEDVASFLPCRSVTASEHYGVAIVYLTEAGLNIRKAEAAISALAGKQPGRVRSAFYHYINRR